METLARAANRGSVSTGYDIDNSLKFEADNTEKIQSAESDAGNRRTWTHSSWVKQGDFGRKKSFFMVGPSLSLIHI